jgi:hypothetical protein
MSENPEPRFVAQLYSACPGKDVVEAIWQMRNFICIQIRIDLQWLAVDKFQKTKYLIAYKSAIFCCI